jgi:hypothetical protein
MIMLSRRTIAALSCPTCQAVLIRLPDSGGVWVCPDGLHSREYPDHVLWERVMPTISWRLANDLGVLPASHKDKGSYCRHQLNHIRLVLRKLMRILKVESRQAVEPEV